MRLLRLFHCRLQTLAHEFIENAVNVGCMFAKHRNSNVLETKDLQLHMLVPRTPRLFTSFAITNLAVNPF
jgi:hypothetical protein